MRFLKFASISVLCLILGTFGCAFLGLGAYTFEMVGEIFLSRRTLVPMIPMNATMSTILGADMMLISIFLSVAFVACGVLTFKKICDEYSRLFPGPNMLTAFF